MTLSETAQKIKQIEERQISQLQTQVEAKQVEITKLREEIEKYEHSKEEKLQKTVILNDSILEMISQFSKNRNIDQLPEISSLYDENVNLSQQLSFYFDNSKPDFYQNKIENLETELFELTEKRAILNDQSGNNDTILQRLKENKDLLKQQISQMEENMALKVRFETDERKNKIKLLQKKKSNLSSELHRIRTEKKNLSSPSNEDHENESLLVMNLFYKELKNSILAKEKNLEMLKEEQAKSKKELDVLKSQNSTLLIEINRIRGLYFSEK